MLAEHGVEEHATGAVELRDARRFAPADEHVAVREQLHAALAAGEDPRMGVLAQERRRHRPLVDVEDQAARAPLDRRRRAVVEDRERSIGLAARVVLPGEVAAGAHLEVAALAAETPDDRRRSRSIL